MNPNSAKVQRGPQATPVVALIASILLALSSVAGADGRRDVAACKAIADSALRLACFDALPSPEAPVAPAAGTQVSPPPSASAVPQVPAAGPVPAAPAPTLASPSTKPAPLMGAEAFGAESVPAQIKQQPKSLVAKVNGNIRGIRKGMVISLDNGQRWRSVDDREYDYDGDRPEATIERNLIGTYWMKFPDSGFRVRVRRIQ